MREINLPFDAKKSLGVFASEDGRKISVLINGDTGDIITAFSVIIYQLKSRVGIPYELIKHIVDFTKNEEPIYQELYSNGLTVDVKELLRQVGNDDC